MPMIPTSSPSPKGKALCLSLKAALRAMHEGPDAVPRKVIWMALGRSEAWYSKCLSNDYDCLPDVVELVCIVNLTGDLRVALAVTKFIGEGFTLAPLAPSPPITAADGLRRLERMERVDGAVHHSLAEDLANDLKVDPNEARLQLPAARERARDAQEYLVWLERVALGVEPLPLRRAE